MLFKYYTDGHWVEDKYAKNIKSILFSNIIRCLSSYNTRTNVPNFNDIIANQEYISNMLENSTKHQKAVFDKIIEEITNNNMNHPQIEY